MDTGGGHALVTGGGTGIGRAIARALTAQGCVVTLVGRKEAPLAALAGDLPGAGYIPCDVTRETEVVQAVVEAQTARGPLRILVNNAGAVTSSSFEKTSLEAWSAALDVNLLGAVRMIKAALPGLRTQPSARIINIASTAGLKPYAYVSAYVAAKHALVGLTKSLALELATSGITVNAVCPGYTRTAIVEQAIETIAGRTGRGEDAALQVFTGANPQGRLVTPEEVAAAVAWLASPEAGAVNGIALSVSGGETG